MEENRKTGIDTVGAVPWGMHLCNFYDTKQDLIDVLVPYFKTGLENNEFCIWVTSELLGEKEAEEAMRKAMPDFAQYLERRQILIVPHAEVYLKDGYFALQRVLDYWIDKLNQALARGYDGMRVTGDMAWLEEKDWASFTEYEEEVNNVIGEYPMLAICNYSLKKCGAAELVDVLRNHRGALIRQAGKWVATESSEYGQLQHDLEERGKELECLYGVTNIAERPGITLDELYQEVANLLPQGWQYPEITCAKITTNDEEFKTENYRETEWKQSSDINVRGARIGTVEIGYLEARPEVDEGPFLREERQLIDAVARQLGDITERRQTEDTLEESEGKYRTVFSEARDGIVLIDSETGRIGDCNKEFENQTGRQLEQLKKMKIWEIRPPEKTEAAKKKFLEIRRRGVGGSSELEYQKPNGEIVNIEFASKKIRIGDKQYLESISRDITERKQAGDWVVLKPEKSQAMTLRAAPRRRVSSLQEWFIRAGFEGLSDQEMIGLLLSLVLPYRECKQLARDCIEHFKSLRGFLAASDQELQRVGITPTGLFCIKLLHELPEEILKQKIVDQPVYKSSQEVFNYLYYSMRDLKKEVFRVIYLNTRSQIIDTEVLFEGTIEDAPVRPREIVEAAIKHDAVRLIFAHNHPAGDPTPSKSDKQLTRDLVFFGNIIQIKVLDHIIIGGNSYFSFADEGLIQKYEDDFLNMRIRKFGKSLVQIRT